MGLGQRPYVVAGVVALVAALFVTQVITGLEAPAGPEQRVQHLSQQLWCPVCPGQTVADSTSGTALAMKETVREMVEEGKTDQEILDYFVSQYGADILTRPPTTGFASAAWLGALVGLLVGGLSFVLFLRPAARRPELPAAGGDAEPDAEEEARVERVLRHYL